MGHDSSDINQKLWSRKKLKIRRDRNEKGRVKAAYFKSKDTSEVNDNAKVSDKQKEFYDQLFKKDENTENATKSKNKKKKSKSEKKLDATESRDQKEEE